MEIPAIQSALAGMHRSVNEIQKDAGQIASASVRTETKNPVTQANLVEPLVDMQQQQLYSRANVKTMATADDMMGTILSLKA